MLIMVINQKTLKDWTIFCNEWEASQYIILSRKDSTNKNWDNKAIHPEIGLKKSNWWGRK